MTALPTLHARLVALRLPRAVALLDAVGVSLAVEAPTLELLAVLVDAVEDARAEAATLREMVARGRA